VIKLRDAGRLAVLLCLFVLAAPAHAQWTAEGGVLLRGKIVTMDENNTVKQGSIYIKDGKIEAIMGPDAPVPEGAIELKTDGAIYPGMINLHDHPAYDFLPPYDVPKDTENRYKWNSGKCYERFVNNPKNLVTESGYFDRMTEALKFALVKHIVGGTTSSQGAPANQGAGPILTRDVEHTDLGGKIGGSVLPIDGRFTADLAANRNRIKGLQAWIFHLAEGKDERSRLEYSNPDYNPRKPPGPNNVPGLKQLGLVTKNLIGIHSTALTEADFKDWKKTAGEGAKVVWSPLSNLMLYGETTDVVGAMRQGATIALGTDWTPSGSKNLLWEIKVADQVNKQRLDGALSDADLVSMVTRNPAKMLGWEDKVGMIKKGMVADLVVLDNNVSNAYRNLIDATERAVQLVFVGGDPLYGDAKVMKKLKGDRGAKGLEPLDDLNRGKLLDLKRDLPKGNQSLKQIQSALAAAAKINAKELARILNEGDPTNKKDPFKARTAMKEALASYLKKDGETVPASLKKENLAITEGQVEKYISYKFPYAEPLKMLDSVFQEGDDRFFEMFMSNLHFAGDDAVLDISQIASAKGLPADIRKSIREAHDAAHDHAHDHDHDVAELSAESVRGARGPAPYSEGMTSLIERRVAAKEGKDVGER
jgi:cytosine/adenosine deaminase-related metal-dependent hydrolase